MELPLQLQNAIENELTSQSLNKITVLAAELSDNYRNRTPSKGDRYLRSKDDAAAYAAYRLPATFAAVSAAINQVLDRSFNLRPQTLLDVGAGPGTATWAATTLLPELKQITLLERDENMIDLGKRLSSYSELASLKESKWIKTDIKEDWQITPQDLVIASYVLNELSLDDSQSFINKLWESTAHTLLIIEPGTPAGFSRIKKAREQLIALGANTIAPCPHNNDCPMTEDDWCHFSQRIARSKLHRKVKSGELSYEDEKFSFLCMSHNSIEMKSSIVIRHPQVRKGHINLELCTPSGLTNTIITKKSKELYRKARDLDWGSLMPEEDC